MTEKKENRVDEIIEAAISEFLENGYEKASMESIAKRANLSKGGLYHHFKSKSEILFTVNLKFMEPIQVLLYKIETTESITEGLKQYIADYLEYWSHHKRELKLYFLTMNEAFNNPEIMQLYKEATSQIFSYFKSIFKKGIEISVFRSFNPLSHAISLISCLDGFLGYLLIDETINPEEVSSEIQKIFIDNMLAFNSSK
jgi:AcrR family transcriptional regulator